MQFMPPKPGGCFIQPLSKAKTRLEIRGIGKNQKGRSEGLRAVIHSYAFTRWHSSTFGSHMLGNMGFRPAAQMLPKALSPKNLFESKAAALRIRRVCCTEFFLVFFGNSPAVWVGTPFPINVLISPLAELWIQLLLTSFASLRKTLPFAPNSCCIRNENNIKIYDDKLSTPAAKICKARKNKTK